MTSPSERLPGPLERGSARLLASCILVLIVVFSALDVLLVKMRPGYIPPVQGYLFLLFAYGLSRTRRYRWGAIATTLMFPLVAVSLALSGKAAQGQPLVYALLAPFFASLFLGVRGATTFALLTPLAVGSVPALLGLPFDDFFDAIAANVIAGLIAVSYSVHRDWIERRRSEASARHEAEIIHLQKMEAIGRMAGGIAHDFNNLLTVIAGGTELLLRTSDRKELKLIESATRSAQDLTEQLLTLSRQQVVGSESSDVAAVLDSTKQLLSRIIGEDIVLRLEVDAHLGSVNLSHGQLQQVLLNLATNARDAMPRGGVLTFQAKRKGHDFLCLSVSDTGVGMPDSVREKIFEPFFTTKRVGEGTGLGLAMVFGLVSQAGGTILVESSVGVGTKFILHLPRATKAAEEPPVLSERRLSLGGTARGRILLVEDDASVRELCRSVLRKEGFDVMEAAEPKEALEQYRASHSGCDLIITDVVMPGMSGPELVEVIRQTDPNLPALFVSGYAPDDVVGEGLPGVFLPKPFRPTELLRKVSAMLYGLDSHVPPATTVQDELEIPSAASLPSDVPTATTEPPVSGAVEKDRRRKRSEQPVLSSGKIEAK